MINSTVQDIMVPLDQYPCLPETLSLRDAIGEMQIQIHRRNHTSLPRVALVFDEGMRRLLGMLRRRDILRGLEPSFLLSGSLDYRRKLFDVAADPNLAELSYDKVVAHIRRRAGRSVGDLMVPIPATIEHDDHIMKAMSELVDRNTSLLPVLRDGTVIGVVRSVDVLNEIAFLLNA
jgi:CBS domain-containing protein